MSPARIADPVWAHGKVRAQTNIRRVNTPRARSAPGPDRFCGSTHQRFNVDAMSKNSHRHSPWPTFAGHAEVRLQNFSLSTSQPLTISFSFFSISRRRYHKPAFCNCPGDRNRTVLRPRNGAIYPNARRANLPVCLPRQGQVSGTSVSSR